MSNLLTDALIDAEALRETALKNAEAILLEKFSDQIKDAVETILTEAPEDEELPMDDEAAAEEMDVEEEVPEMPLASAEGVEMCPCPDNEKEEIIDFDQLEAELDKMEASEEDMETSEEAAEDMPLEEELLDINEEELEEMAYAHSEEVDLEEELLEELADMLNEEDDPMGKDAEAQEAAEEAAEKGGESSDLEATSQPGVQKENLSTDDDQLLEDLIEALKVDIDPLKTEKSGWMNTPQGTFQLAEEELLAMLEDSEVREQRDEMKKALKRLEETTDKLKKEKKELLSITSRMKKQIKESNLTNSKLLYTNKVLMSDSLNERQKFKIAEALSNAETVEEAKTIYETLQSATGSTVEKKKPESLSEAVNKTTSTLILSHRKRDKEEKTQNSSSERWKILAGLK
jgi:general stress protein YciG